MAIKENFFIQDLSIIALSIIIAFVMESVDLFSGLLQATTEVKLVGSFVAGMFFTSIFTTAPAITALGEIAHSGSVLWTAIFGAAGAVVGDMVIFRFVRDRLSDHFMVLLQHEGWLKRVKALFRLKYFRWFTFLLGGFIIASPFPDELGISLLGFSKMNLRTFIPISFIFNFIGILSIGLIAKAL